MQPAFGTGEFVALASRREDVGELQTFADSNAEYWLMTRGQPPAADDAARRFEQHPPADMSYSEHLHFLVRDVATNKIVGLIDIATDLLAPGVYHLGFFMTATPTHGTGFAHRLYSAYERWAAERGARWSRLGVVEANRRAVAFWRRAGYIELRREPGYKMGDLTHVMITMAKPLQGETLGDYLAAVSRDRS